MRGLQALRSAAATQAPELLQTWQVPQSRAASRHSCTRRSKEEDGVGKLPSTDGGPYSHAGGMHGEVQGQCIRKQQGCVCGAVLCSLHNAQCRTAGSKELLTTQVKLVGEQRGFVCGQFWSTTHSAHCPSAAPLGGLQNPSSVEDAPLRLQCVPFGAGAHWYWSLQVWQAPH